MVQLNDGSNDRIAVPAALHEIHCLRTLREAFFLEHYPITAQRYPHEPGEMNVYIGKSFTGLHSS